MKVAILQFSFAKGGGAKVLGYIVRNLNAHGIIPDVYTIRGISSAELSDHLDLDINYNLITVGRYLTCSIYPLSVLLFNLLIHRDLKGYELVVNSQNCCYFIPKNPALWSYVHFPKALEQAVLVTSEQKGLIRGFYEKLIRSIYMREPYERCRWIACNSEFTREALLQVNPVLVSTSSVVYPPLSFGDCAVTTSSKLKMCLIVGKFGSDKRQIELLDVAFSCPDFRFVMVGGADTSGAYYRKLESIIEARGLTNVYLHPNETSRKLAELYREASVFIHAKVCEHFGLVTIEAISAGCLPLVHNSGGQVEIVEDKNLRFDEIRELPEKIKFYIDRDNTRDLEKLTAGLERFAIDQFDLALDNAFDEIS